MNDVMVRKVDTSTDSSELLRLDTSFSSTRMYQVLNEPGGSLRLDSIPVSVPIVKRFPLQLDADPWSNGWVVLSAQRIVGFIATGYESWNRRLVIWHFYVDANQRRSGFGRLLMKRALEHGVSIGARTAWLETTNLNYSGVRAYMSLGFQICGFDLTLYRGTPAEGEFALFMARPLDHTALWSSR
jgi:ribosomal protein S18 acetylase RimI-like enzyme